MFLAASPIAVESDIHRARLLAEARTYRLAKLAAKARRRKRRAETVVEPPTPPAEPPAGAAGPEEIVPARRGSEKRDGSLTLSQKWDRTVTELARHAMSR
jgi:hypothetical protein